MALIKCSECGHGMSDKAKTCPNCGYKKPVDYGLLAGIILIVIFALFIGVVVYKSPVVKEKQAKQKINTLIDDLIYEGHIDRYDTALRRLYISRLMWDAFSNPEKETFVQMAWLYMNEKAGDGSGVTVYDTNNTELAKMSQFNVHITVK